MEAVAGVVERARKGDPEAFRELVEAHSDALFRLAYRMTGNEDMADDVVQETFLRAHRNLGRFDGRAQLRTWLCRIAANCAIDGLRRRRRDALEPLDEDRQWGAVWEAGDPGPERLARSREAGAIVRRTMARLSPLERAAFALRHYEGQPLAEIGRALGVGEGAVKQAVFRAVQKLRAALQPVVG
jgi:RNA polymerase sigma-70 factor (ECF subfamily)